VVHVAWGQVAALASGRRDPVFGTVLFGRMQGGEGADRAVGLFINALPIRLRLGASSARDSVAEVHRLLGELMRHEHASAALAQRCSGLDPQVPLFTSLLNFRHGVLPSDWRAEGAEAAWADIGYIGGEERTNFPLLMAVDDLGDAFQLSAQAPGDTGPERICAMMHRALETLVEALERHPSTPVGELEVLPPEERRRLLVEWNDTARGRAHDRCIHELFEDQAASTPDATALVHEARSMSYAELDARSNQLAHHLRSLGVGPGAMVGLHLERTPELVVGLLAILKAGGVYVPMDPAYPAERLGFMLEDTRAEVIVTRSGLAGTLAGHRIHTVSLDLDGIRIGNWPTPPLPGLVTPADLAYVIYTSGSTGRPKGVLTTHAGVLNRSRMQDDIDPYFDGSRCAQKASIGFVDSVFEILCPLVRGKTVVIFAHEVTIDADAFVGALEEASIHHIVTVPSQGAAMLETGRLGRLTELRSWTLGGEELSPALLQSIRRCLPRCRIINLYGCSEFTDAATTCVDPDASDARVPIGGPVDNTRIYVLSPDLTPVPAGVVGELYLAGDSLSRGYLNRPGFTAERYLPCPFGAPGGRMYRTGDLGRWRPDGTLESLGRADFQVKMRGFRIELGEIEARMLECPGVREAVVLAREDQPGDRRLVAYYSGEAEPSSLRAHLVSVLPGHMVPAAHVWMEAFPSTSSGKLARKALPPPGGEAFAARAYEPPVGPTEEAVAAAWADILGVERVGRHDNFFELGGHSLLATTVIGAVRRRFGIGASLRSVFEAPTVASFAARLESGDRDMAFFHTSDGQRIAYQTWGDDASGPVVVLQHGFATNAAFDWVFTGVVSELRSQGRRVVALDARGHGESDKPHSPERYGLQRSALDIRELLDHLGAREADLVGFSMGAVAVLRATAGDARVRRLVLAGVGEGLIPGGGAEEAFPVTDIVDALVADEPDPAVDPDALWFRDLADRSGSDRIALAAHLSAPPQGAVPLASVRVPTLIVAGEDDRLARRPGRLAAALADARVAMVPGDHRTTLAAPRFKTCLVEFLCRGPGG
jgi:amino acid adenylation domain-containing protein